MHHPAAPSLSGGPTLLADPELDVEPHLPLVAHVVRQLSLRMPPQVDRAEMWRHGALGLAVAARWTGVGPGFGTAALRSVRQQILDGLRDNAPAPSTSQVARLLGIPEQVLLDHQRPFEPVAGAVTVTG